MKTVLAIAILLTFSLLVLGQSKPFDVVVTNVTKDVSLVGDSRDPSCSFGDNSPDCVQIKFYISLENWKHTAQPFKGQMLKAVWIDEQFAWAPDCIVPPTPTISVRHEQGIYKRRVENLTPPEDGCGPLRAKFVLEVLKGK